MPPRGHSFGNLQQSISQDHSILMEDLSDGNVDASADLLLVMAPENLDERARFAIDQYLMRGGTVIVATAPRSIEAQGAQLTLRTVSSGLEDWLAHHGITIEETVILDERQATFPVPVLRRVGAYEFREMQFVEYPYLLDVRDEGLNSEHPITGSLPQLTVGWASPITLEPSDALSVTTLLRSSENAWRSDERNVMPSVDASGQFTLRGTNEARQPATLGVVLEGEFRSYFDRVPQPQSSAAPPEDGPDKDAEAPGSALISKSPSSARLLVVSSNDFASDQVLSGVIAASGTQYLGPLEFLMNAVDWALEDSNLMSIRSRAHFNRTLPALNEEAHATIEYGNYLAAAFLLLTVYGFWRLRRRYRTAQLGRMLTGEAPL
jgi:ABC-2 type transport system permease protein